jgi:quinol monooxygenase YgiN
VAITRINDFHAAPGKERGLREFLTSVIAVIKEAPGCRAVELLIDRDDTGHLVIVEHWDDIASHQAAAPRIPPSRLAEVRPLVAQPPQGRSYDPTWLG